MYRPQYAFPAPLSDCLDQRFHYAYDASNTPTLAQGSLAAGGHTGRIPLQMDQDAPFYLLAIQQQASGLQLRLESPYADPLSDSGNTIESTNYVFSALYSETDGAAVVTIDGDAVPEGGIYCPRGGVLNLYINNPSGAPINLNTILLTLHGKKRYKPGCVTHD